MVFVTKFILKWYTIQWNTAVTSAVDLSFARAVFGQDCPLVWHYFQQLAIYGNVGNGVVYVVLNGIGPPTGFPEEFFQLIVQKLAAGMVAESPDD